MFLLLPVQTIVILSFLMRLREGQTATTWLTEGALYPNTKINNLL